MNHLKDPNFQFFVEKKGSYQAYHLEPGSMALPWVLVVYHGALLKISTLFIMASPEAMAQLTLLLLASMGLKIGTLRPTMVRDSGGEIYT